MTLDEAITTCMEVISEQMELCRDSCPTICVVGPTCTETAAIHFQLLQWLEELKWRRNQQAMKHGRWIKQENGLNLCSVCGVTKVSHLPVCGHCGAKMDDNDTNDSKVGSS